MKTQTNLIVVLIIIIASALVFAGIRTWGLNRALVGGNWPELEGGVYSEAVTSGGLKYLVPPDEVYDSGLDAESNPALTEPKYDNVDTSDESVADDLSGIALEVDGQAYFYPVQIMNWHPVVNDVFGEQELAITYSTLSGSAVVYNRKVGDQTLEFADAGKVYNNTLLMSAGQGDTLWNQTSGQAIVGDEVGQRLEIYPSHFMTWLDWKEANPSGLVLSFDTGFERDYTRHPYAAYETSPAIYFPLNHTFPRIPVKQVVYRLDHEDQNLAFVSGFLRLQSEPNETLGEGDSELPVVAFYDSEISQIRVYDRRVDGQVLTFGRTEDGWEDQETGSTWDFEGRATSGRHEDAQLTELPVTRHYAFAHFALFPNTILSGDDLIPQTPAESEDDSQTLEVQ